MISAKIAKMETEKALKQKCNISPKQKLLPINQNKKYYISLPFKLKVVESVVEDAIKIGENSCRIRNEITPEAEECLIENGYKVEYYESFIEISW